MSEYGDYNPETQNTSDSAEPECVEEQVQSQSHQDESSPAKITGYGLMSIILAPMGCCCAVPSVVGLAAGIIGLTKHRRNILCICGIILCSLVILYFCYYAVQNADQYREMFEWAMQNYGQPSAENSDFLRF